MRTVNSTPFPPALKGLSSPSTMSGFIKGTTRLFRADGSPQSPVNRTALPARTAAVGLAFLLFFASLAHAQDLTTRVADLLAEMPAANLEIRDDLMRRLVDTGPDGISLTSQMLTPPGEGDDTRARYALSSLAFYASQPGMQDQRNLAETGFLAALNIAENADIKAFLLDQLLLVAGEKAIDALAPLLEDERLSGHAARVMLAVYDEAAALKKEAMDMGTSERRTGERTEAHAAAAQRAAKNKIEEAFLGAFRSSEGTIKIHMMKNLGYLQADAAVGHILPYLNHEDLTLRRVSYASLARIGHPTTFRTLRRMAERNRDPNDPMRTSESFAVYAERLCEREEYRLCKRASRSIISNNAAPGRYHHYAAALAIYARFFPDEAYPRFVDAIKTGDQPLRAAALFHAQQIGGERETQRWISLAERAESDVRADVIHMLGQRGDTAASGFLRRSMGDPSEKVRVESLNALAILEREQFTEELLLHLASGRDPGASRTILMQILQKDQLPLISSQWDNTSGASRAVLVDLVAARAGLEFFDKIFALTSSADPDERAAAFSALDRVTPENELHRLIGILTSLEEPDKLQQLQYAISKVALRSDMRDEIAGQLLREFQTSDIKKIYLAMLPAFGGEEALNSVVALYRESEGSQKESAARAILNWSDFSAAELLLEMIRTGSDEMKETALQSYITLLQGSGLPDDQKLSHIKAIWDYLETARQKSRVIRHVGELHTLGSLEFLEPFLDDSDLQQEACMAIIAIALPVVFDDAMFTGPYVMELLGKVAEVIDGPESEYLRANILNYLQSTRVEEGFVPLFNGRNLDGWQGNTTGYVVENGNLVFRPDRGERGHLYTDSEYSDFIVRIEFKLTPAANNGLAIRTPLTGNPAYEGMEIQILDDDDPIYENLREYQYNGSVYGIIPAKRGFLNPVGEWNSKEVTARGSHITVVLNGETIVDGCILEASKDGTIDGREHPGLLRESGHIAFMSHGTVVSFRNIRIKEL